MNRSLLILFFLFLTSILNAQTYSSLIPDKEIEEFIVSKINDTTKPTLIYSFYSNSILLWRKSMLQYQDSIVKANPSSIYHFRKEILDSILSLDDKLFFLEQIDSFKTKTWELKQIPHLSKKKLKNGVTYLSYPLFTKDKQFAIFKQLYRCGQDCGNDDILIYKKFNGVWKFYKYLIGGIF